MSAEGDGKNLYSFFLKEPLEFARETNQNK